MLPAKLQDLEIVYENLITILLAGGAVALFIMFLSGGFRLLNSGGDAKAAEGAKNTLTYAIGGFVLLAGSFLILRMIGIFTGTGDIITNFKIWKP